MKNGKKAICLLCGCMAERSRFKDPSGWKYECDKCTKYALGGYEHSYIRDFIPEIEVKKKLSAYVKNHPPDENEFKELTINEIKKIIKLF